MEDVRFQAGLQSDFDSLLVKDSGTIYITLDKHRIYKGAVYIGSCYIDELVQKETIELYGGSATDNI